MTMSKQTRRELLRRATALSCVGAASSTFGLQLATLGEAAAQAPGNDFKALVCIFMFGGNDSHNTVLATDTDSWGRYRTARFSGSDSIALMAPGTPAAALGSTVPAPGGGTRTVTATTPERWGGVLPITPSTPNPVPPGTNASVRTFGIHPHMGALLPMWEGGRLAIAANVGPLIQPTTKTQYRNRTVPLPANLMSHNDQQSTWQAGATEGARRGWGGLMADQLLSSNGANSVFTAISTAGNTVFLAGQTVIQYQIAANTSGSPPTPAVRIGSTVANAGVFGTSGASSNAARIREVIRDTSTDSLFGKDHAAKVARSMDSADIFNSAFQPGQPGGSLPIDIINNVTDPALRMTNPITGAQETNQLAVQLKRVAQIIASRNVLGIRRQVFFVSIGGFDNHDVQNSAQPPLLARVAHAMAYFDTALATLNGVDMRPSVTTFTASDFSRTFTTNGDGTDHAWGAHQFMMGGAVRGGTMYGQYPTLGTDVNNGFQNPDMLGNILIPTMSVDQFAGDMGRWFGVGTTGLNSIFPNLRNFPTLSSGNWVGFMNP